MNQAAFFSSVVPVLPALCRPSARPSWEPVPFSVTPSRMVLTASAVLSDIAWLQALAGTGTFLPSTVVILLIATGVQYLPRAAKVA